MNLSRRYDTRSRATVTLKKSTNPEKMRNLLSLPDEILLEIYKAFFNGISLRPYIAEDNGPFKDLFRDSRLALLLLHKSQQGLIQEALWDNACVVFHDRIDLAAIAIGSQNLHFVRSIHLRYYDITSIPSALISNILRKMPELKHLHISGAYGPRRKSMHFKHFSFLSEAKDSTTALRKSAAKDFSLPWLADIFDPRVYSSNSPPAPWKQPPKLDIEFTLHHESVHSVQNHAGLPGQLERFEVPATFSSDIWSVHGTHNNQRFTVEQDPFAIMTLGIHVLPICHNVLVDQSVQEKEVWAIMRTSFPDVALNPRISFILFHQMEWPPPNESLGSRRARLMEKAWSIGAEILGEFEDFTCTSTRSDDEDEYSMTPEQLWDLWRRILHVSDERVLARSWKPAFLLVEDIDQGAQSAGLNYSQQETFFTRLFDPKKAWITE